jgi:RimJ/RimL family protein N-acetyltransferase
MTPTLRTERLLLEPYTAADEDDYVALFRDEKVARWMGSGPVDETADRELFGRFLADVHAHDRFDVWAVRQGRRLVGHAEFQPIEGEEGHEIIFALASDVWRSGLGTELVEAVVRYAFGTLALAEVHAFVPASNTASLALLHRTGFQHVRDIADYDGTTRLLTRTAGGVTHRL